jgi:hypothetical protein
MFRVTPPAGAAPCADASVAMNPVIAQIAQDAKPRRVSIVASLSCFVRDYPHLWVTTV